MNGEPRTADDIWAAAKQLGEAIATQRAAARQAQRDARNARRRARRVASPKPAPMPKAPAAIVVDDDLDLEPGCRCNVVRMPPCAWCENGGES